MRLVLGALVCAALAGCGGGSSDGTTAPPVMQADGPPQLELGFGSDAFQPIAEDEKAQIIHGPQGGYHIVVALRAHGIWPGTPGVPGSPDDPVTSLHAWDASGKELGLMTDDVNVLRQAYQQAPDGDGVVLLDRLLRLATTTPRDLAGQRLLLHADLTSRDGNVLSDEHHVVALAPVN